MNISQKSILFLFQCLLAAGIFQGCCGHISQDKQVCFGRHCFYVEVAQDPAATRLGLQFRKSMAPNKGMLFVFHESSQHDFWMKNTLIALDIIWLDEKGRVIFIAQDLTACKEIPCPRYGPREESRYVLEINAGLAKTLGLKNGGTASLPFNF